MQSIGQFSKRNFSLISKLEIENDRILNEKKLKERIVKFYV
jgi:hypothetical protein